MERQIDAVKSWGRPGIPEAHKDQIDKLLAQVDNIEGELATKWTKVYDSKGIKTWAPAASDNVKLLSFYAEATVGCSAAVAFETINDENLLKQLDPNVEKIQVLESDYHNRYSYVQMKGVYWTAPRDFCTLDHWFAKENGTIYKATLSVDRPEAPEHPNPKTRVRAYTYGWTVVRPDPLDEAKCFVQTKVDLDIRMDQVPKWVQKTFAGSAQKVNAQSAAAHLAQITVMARKKQRGVPFSHILVNQGGEINPEKLKAIAHPDNKAGAVVIDQLSELDFARVFLDASVVLVLLASFFTAVLGSLEDVPAEIV
mmetsp:Transcript_1992/g.3246  ORF Transcript_1992/g.3246 Transcript_1992/m.3246 type:complete len:311 (+) Transcript_1992:88-1020(+)